jgi:hypothetical protein
MKITSMPSFKIIKDAVEVSAFLQIMCYVTAAATIIATYISAATAATATTASSINDDHKCV